jgi:hypothetical protein
MPIDITSIIRDPNRKNEIFYLWDLFNADPNARYKTGRFVPNVNDTVIDFEDNSKQYYVKSVDSTYPYKWVIEEIDRPIEGKKQDINLLRGHGPQVASESYVVYVDKTVTPNTLSFGNTMFTYSSNAHHIVVFKYNNITGSKDIVSGYYDNDGRLTTSNIPLELAATNVVDNITIKAPKPAYCIAPLFHGELVTAVVYNDESKTLAVYPFIVSESSTIREPIFKNKHITGIELSTPFLSDTESNVVECQINMPVDDLGLRCKVNYSDGTHRLVDLDGKKAYVDGLNKHVTTQLGQEESALLVYHLSDDEFSNDLANGFVKAQVKQYKFRTTKVKESYYVKLFVIPKWIDDRYGYQLEWYLHDLQRNKPINVTRYINFNSTSMEYDPIRYGTKQYLSVNINLKQVSSMYSKEYIHTQTIQITLLRKGNILGLSSSYLIHYTEGNPPYGEGCYAKRVSSGPDFLYDVSCGQSSQNDWLDHVFYSTDPLFSPDSELKAPKPTHMRIHFTGTETIIPVTDWNKQVAIGDDRHSTIGGNMIIEWVRIINGVTTELGISSMIVESN